MLSDLRVEDSSECICAFPCVHVCECVWYLGYALRGNVDDPKERMCVHICACVRVWVGCLHCIAVSDALRASKILLLLDTQAFVFAHV
jgi:hypothetical protein